MNRKHFPLIIALTSALLGGCAQVAGLQAQLQESMAAGNRATYESEEDKALAHSFYTLEEGGKIEKVDPSMDKVGYMLTSASKDSLHFKRRMVSQEANWGFAQAKMNTYAHATLDDPVVAKYVEVTRARGNTVRLYKPAMGETISSYFAVHHYLDHDRNTQEFYGVDNALIEYGKDGQIVSFLTKSYQGIATLGVSIDEYVHVYFGANAGRFLENHVQNGAFAQTYLRDLPAATPKVVQAAPAPAAPAAAPQTLSKPLTLTASSKCGANEDLVRYTGIKAVQGATRIDAIIVKTGKKTWSNFPADVVKTQAPKIGQFKCWDNQGS